MKSRIRFFRNLRGMTQSNLGMSVGFPKKNADVRIAQYESEDRIPKAPRLAAIAKALNVSPYALSVPHVEDANSLMHLLFTLEDQLGFSIEQNADSVCLKLNERNDRLYKMLRGWHEQAALLSCGKIDQATYDQWRYAYDADKEAPNP